MNFTPLPGDPSIVPIHEGRVPQLWAKSHGPASIVDYLPGKFPAGGSGFWGETAGNWVNAKRVLAAIRHISDRFL
jgi:hypothetical protein